jgi:hypothetical protein
MKIAEHLPIIGLAAALQIYTYNLHLLIVFPL